MSVVYFIRAKETGRIKIGTSSNLKKRLQDIQTSSSEAIAVLCTLSGGEEIEMLLHERFAKTRARGEWFDVSPELVAFIDGVRLTLGQIAAHGHDGALPEGWLISIEEML